MGVGPKATVSLISVLQGFHEIAAFATASPELILSEKEADELDKAIKQVQQFYTTTINPKAVAWFNLTCIAGMIYLPRMFEIYRRVKAQKAEAAKNQEKKP